jgi:hypothetical protein
VELIERWTTVIYGDGDGKFGSDDARPCIPSNNDAQEYRLEIK